MDSQSETGYTGSERRVLPRVETLVDRQAISMEISDLLGRVKSGDVPVETAVAELTERITHLEQERFRDPLTGALNRAAVSMLAYNSGEFGGRFGVLFIDVDNFKQVNDNEPDGHAAGDRALRETVSLIGEVLGERGVVGRWGGEEFVVLVPETNLGKLLEVASKLGVTAQESLAQRAQLNRDQLTFSMGGAVVNIGSREDVALAIARADSLMFEVKQTGRNGMCIAMGADRKTRVDFSSLQKPV